jgi:hypothetical protein
MIEGCACERTDYTARGRSITKLRTGYLTSEEFGLTYAFVALARESHGLDVFKKLSSDAERRVDFAKVSFLEAFPKETEKKRLPQLAVLETLSARIRSLQARDLSLAHLLERNRDSSNHSGCASSSAPTASRISEAVAVASN